MISTKRLTLPLLAVIALSLSGCAGTPTTKEAEAEVDANGNKIEYVWYTPTGSSIPKRVPKSALTQSDSATTQAQNAMTERQRSGNRQNPSGN
jgi:hypothetical protein